MKHLTSFLFVLLLLFTSAALHAQTTTAAVGSKVTFSATADGTPPIVWQWKKNGADLPGKTDAVFVISLAATVDDAGTYAVRATNAFGSATSDNAVLVIGVPPSKPVIKTGLSPVTSVRKQSNVTLAVEVTGDAPLSYSWWKNNTKFYNETKPALSLYRVNPSSAGTYTVVVSNPLGSAQSSTRLSVH